MIFFKRDGFAETQRKTETICREGHSVLILRNNMPLHLPEVPVIRDQSLPRRGFHFAGGNRRQTFVPSAGVTGIKRHGPCTWRVGPEWPLQQFSAFRPDLDRSNLSAQMRGDDDTQMMVFKNYISAARTSLFHISSTHLR